MLYSDVTVICDLCAVGQHEVGVLCEVKWRGFVALVK